MEIIITNLEKCLTDLKVLDNSKSTVNQSKHNPVDLQLLYDKIEDKCEKVELLEIEVEKWKSHGEKLEEARLLGIKSLANANSQIAQLEQKISCLELKLKSKSAKYSKLKKFLEKKTK
jgi:chromosome segregation ATPase